LQQTIVIFRLLSAQRKNILRQNDISSRKEISQALVFQIPVIISGGYGCCKTN